ncbi:MAG: hypothetical protein LBC67_06535, partial [Spirochaetales bacterium]|nr:hypothetical protein [Spirochaetales bacterium]
GNCGAGNNDNAAPFSALEWPLDVDDMYSGVWWPWQYPGDESSGVYWKPGRWDDGNGGLDSDFPKLYWE